MTDIAPILRNRWSLRTFDPTHILTEAEITLLLEAARWAPSARNLQPWRFIVAQRGDNRFTSLLDSTREQTPWCQDASALIANVALVNESPYAVYDLGGAVQHLVLQGETMGLHSCLIASFDPDQARKALNLGEGQQLVTLTAIGLPAPDAKPLRIRERAPLTSIRLA